MQTTDNARYSYFGMDAGVGVDNGKFYLFGGTGNFSDLGGREENMDNIMYGIIDPHYPLFKQLYDEELPLGTANDFEIKAHLELMMQDQLIIQLSAMLPLIQTNQIKIWEMVESVLIELVKYPVALILHKKKMLG